MSHDVNYRKLFTPAKYRLIRELQTPKRLAELSRQLKISKQAVHAHLQELIRIGFVKKSGNMFFITKTGKIFLDKVREVTELTSVLTNLGEFLNTHDLTPIPHEMLLKIGDLQNAKVAVRKPYEIDERFLSIISDSKWVLGLSTVYHPEYPSIFCKLSTKANVCLILQKDIYEKVRKRNYDELVDYLRRGEMYICEGANLNFIVSESGLIMGLYTNDGIYDSSSFLICRSKSASEWGAKLFRYYLKKSQKIFNP
ncbi:helix-turn-helix transcriptional regulator [Archaeoglobus neptunius]|uniref:helix-turn-helix transcriptional regulator n=1 Tax=Archaeoglobus neptunius TaxID=2798580 RepID=UPI001926FCAC|nr:transcriptional regulator FilR1 domain-containing protein [Archaeoglobus neptunius]